MAFTTATSGEDPSLIFLEGELDLATVPQLNDRIDQLLETGHPHIVLDLSQLSFCDSTGLSAFVRGSNLCVDAGGWLRVTGATSVVARVLTVTGLGPSSRPSNDRRTSPVPVLATPAAAWPDATFLTGPCRHPPAGPARGGTRVAPRRPPARANEMSAGPT
ncbi:STAS domain-containing protein [Plantactinospora sp. WMMB782]|uniref:STAS domain-containing protein n=1 Tax=Plantactinospora sp. WMMB782 TaxID=3404121 RepID=UPI003B92A98A